MKLLLEPILYLVLFFYLAAALLHWAGTGKKQWRKAASVFAGLGCVFHGGALLIRTLLTGMLPLTNGPEFLLTFAWFTVLLHLFFEFRHPRPVSGRLVMLLSAVLVAVVLVFMQDQVKDVVPLMPALKSSWLTVHVLSAALAYAFFALAAGLAARRLIKARDAVENERLNLLIRSGFILLTLSITTGAVWAEQAWGKYWSWDPKESWALFTWIVYALYLHLCRNRPWRDKYGPFMVIAGFALVLFTFFGVNYLLPGLHSYA